MLKNICKKEIEILRGVLLILLQTVIAGWDELECHRVFNFLCDLTNLQQKTEGVITAKPGVCVPELSREQSRNMMLRTIHG